MSRKIVGVTVGTPIRPQAIIEKVEFDKKLSRESENAVQNKVIATAIFDIYKRLEALEGGIVVVNNTAKLGTAILGKMILGKGA